MFLPPYDTSATLAKLAAVVGRLHPRRIVALGDSFHDRSGSDRLLPHDVTALRAIQAGRDWLWIAGNHDPAPPAALDGEHATQARRRPHLLSPPSVDLALRRRDRRPPAPRGDRRRQGRQRAPALLRRRRPTLHHAGLRRYAGGLNFLGEPVRALFGGGEHLAHVLGRSAVYTVARKQCLMDSVTYEPWL